MMAGRILEVLKLKVKIWCNGHGWLMGDANGFKFTMTKAGAKPYDPLSKELEAVKMRIENTLMCNYDLVLEMG